MTADKQMQDNGTALPAVGSRLDRTVRPLKPCPFCMSDGDRLMELWDNFDAGHIAFVHCTCCGVRGPSVYSENGAGNAVQRARWKWNGRALAWRRSE
jgi:hypothetical protein